MKLFLILIVSVFNLSCQGGLKEIVEPSYLAPAEINYRTYFARNISTLDPIEGVWTEFVVGTLYEDGKVLERKEIPRRARWIIIKDGLNYKILNQYGEQNKYIASFKKNIKDNFFTFDCLFINTKDHIKTNAELVDGVRIEMAYNAPDGIFKESYKEFTLSDLSHNEKKNLELFWQFNWLKTYPLNLPDD